MAQALIFDMDGTMIDSMGHHRQAWIAFACSSGTPAARAAFMCCEYTNWLPPATPARCMTSIANWRAVWA